MRKTLKSDQRERQDHIMISCLSDFDQTWYAYLLGHATQDKGLLLKFAPRGTRKGPLKGKLGQVSKRYILLIYQVKLNLM